MKRPSLQTIIERPFPSFGIRNIKLYYLISLFSISWFIIGNWLFFALNYLTVHQMAVVEAISFGLGLLLEIPSGAIADLLGKKRTTQIGIFMLTFGTALCIFAYISPWFFVFGNIILVTSFAFTSGSLEALAYDSMVEVGREDAYDVVAGRVGTLTAGVFVITALLGGIMWSYSQFLPWIASVSIFLVALLLTFWLREPAVDTYTFSWKQFIAQNKIGFSQLFNPGIKPYLFIILAISGVYYMWTAGIIRITMGGDFGYDGETLSYLISAAALASAIFTYKFDQLKNLLGNGKGLFVLAVMIFLGWFLAGMGAGLFVGAIIFFLITIAGNLNHPWRSSLLNKHVPSKYRATTISTLQFLVQIPYVVVVIYFGILVGGGLQHYFYYAVAGVLLAAIVLSYWARFRRRYLMI